MTKTLKAFENKKAFIPFITAGYPNADASVEYILAAADAGADLIEVGIPFSDPTAEGPVIQKADMVALQNGMTVKGAFEVVERVRKVKPDLPIAFMTYINPVFKFRGDAPEGVETEPYVPFFERCKADGIDALILADRRIAKSPRGFIYVVSSMGVTGVRSSFAYDTIGNMVRLIRETNPSVKCAVGFGISTPEQAEKMASISDGAIVGSAILRLIAGGGTKEDVYNYVKSMKDAVDRA